MPAFILVILVYFIFLLLPPIGMIFHICRNYTMWNEHDKINQFYDMKSDFLAKILIKKYVGWNQKVVTDIPILYSYYYANKYPNRISKCSLIQYIAGLVISVIWIISVNFWFLGINLQLIFYAGILLIVSMLMISAVGVWNSALYDFWDGSWTKGGLNMKIIDEKDILTKEEYKIIEKTKGRK